MQYTPPVYRSYIDKRIQGEIDPGDTIPGDGFATITTRPLEKGLMSEFTRVETNVDNLVADNVAKDVNILGIVGNLEPSNEPDLSDTTIPVNGFEWYNQTLQMKVADENLHGIIDWMTVFEVTDPAWINSNIREGVMIFGKSGSYAPSAPVISPSTRWSQTQTTFQTSPGQITYRDLISLGLIDYFTGQGDSTLVNSVSFAGGIRTRYSTGTSDVMIVLTDEGNTDYASLGGLGNATNTESELCAVYLDRVTMTARTLYRLNNTYYTKSVNIPAGLKTSPWIIKLRCNNTAGSVTNNATLMGSMYYQTIKWS